MYSFSFLILISMIVLLLSACGRGHDGGDYIWIGCHVVHTNPADCIRDKCVYAYGPEGDKAIGKKIYFKQADKYGKVGPIVTARPCKEGE